MENNTFFGFVAAFIFIFYLGSTASLADTSEFHITGYVTDGINMTDGIPGANVTLINYNTGVKAESDSINPTVSNNNSDNVGFFEFYISQPGCYQVYAENGNIDTSINRYEGWSGYLIVSKNTENYSVSVVLMLNESPNSSAFIVTISPTQLPTVIPTPTPGSAVTVTPAPVVITPGPTTVPVPTEAVIRVSPEASTPLYSNVTNTINTPVPTPGVSFTFIPTFAVICLIALRKRN